MSEEPLDLELMKALALGITVPSANESMRKGAALITTRCGGDGAVLEICNLILQHKGALRVSKTMRQATV
jgi:3-deoxy-D-manno-octulosonate 8-phosphate phosphatase (KDO 8-P phosphatase)